MVTPDIHKVGYEEDVERNTVTALLHDMEAFLHEGIHRVRSGIVSFRLHPVRYEGIYDFQAFRAEIRGHGLQHGEADIRGGEILECLPQAPGSGQPFLRG